MSDLFKKIATPIAVFIIGFGLFSFQNVSAITYCSCKTGNTTAAFPQNAGDTTCSKTCGPLATPNGTFEAASTSTSPVSNSNTQASGTITLENPLKVSTPQALIGLIINIALGLSGSIALLLFVYGGILWMTSAGDKAKVTKGIDTMIWAAIGMAVVFASAAIVRFLLTSLLR
ncbi:MAG: pilin [Patescibacteria group bacterium]